MNHDIVNLADELKGDALLLHLGPQKWNSFTTSIPLEWGSVPWKKEQKTNVPAVRGIYAFTVQFSNSLLPRHGYIVYVGMTGDKSKSKSTLRARFGNYFTTREKDKGRTRVGYILNKWGKHLTFQFAKVVDRRFSLSKLEKHLCDAVIPYASRNDLTARLRKGKEAAGL